MNLAKGHEVLHEVVLVVAACFAVVDLESRIVMPPCATSEVLPDQKVTIDIFDAGMRLCTSMKSREEVTNNW